MDRIAIVVVLVLGLAGSAQANSQADLSSQLVGAQKLELFEFAAPDGTFESREIPLKCDTRAIYLKAQMLMLGKQTTKWYPAMTLTIEGDTKTAAIQLVSPDFHETLNVYLTTTQPASDPDHLLIRKEKLSRTFVTEESVPILASWASSGVVTFNVAGETKSVDLNGPVMKAELSGSTGGGLFEPIEIGRIAGSNSDSSCDNSAN